MDSVLRAVAVYGFLLVIFRITGKRSLAQITTFDAIVLLIISEAVQQALIDGDESMTNAFILVVTLMGADVLMSILSMRFSKVDKVLNDVPLVLVDDGELQHERMTKARVTPDDILESARALRGISRFDQIKYAVLERDGAITIIPQEGSLRFSPDHA